MTSVVVLLALAGIVGAVCYLFAERKAQREKRITDARRQCEKWDHQWPYEELRIMRRATPDATLTIQCLRCDCMVKTKPDGSREYIYPRGSKR